MDDNKKEDSSSQHADGEKSDEPGSILEVAARVVGTAAGVIASSASKIVDKPEDEAQVGDKPEPAEPKGDKRPSEPKTGEKPVSEQKTNSKSSAPEAPKGSAKAEPKKASRIEIIFFIQRRWEVIRQKRRTARRPEEKEASRSSRCLAAIQHEWVASYSDSPRAWR